MKLLAYDPYERISADEALKHEFFAEFYTNLDNQRDFRSTFFTMKQPNRNVNNEEGEYNST